MSLIYTAPAAAPGVSSGNGLYIGGKKEAKSRSTLGRWGITHILNVTPEKDSSIQVSFALLSLAFGAILVPCTLFDSYLVWLLLRPSTVYPLCFSTLLDPMSDVQWLRRNHICSIICVLLLHTWYVIIRTKCTRRQVYRIILRARQEVVPSLFIGGFRCMIRQHRICYHRRMLS